MLNSIARRITWVAASTLWLSTVSAGTPPSLQGALPGPAGKASVKDTGGNGNPAIGVDGRVGVMVVLDGEPAAMTYRHALMAAGSHGPTAVTVAGAASRQAVNQLTAKQGQFLTTVNSKGIHYEELFRAQRTINGIAMRVLPHEMQELAKLPGVARVEYLPYETPSNITSVPFIGAPQVWTGVNSLGLPFDATGTGVRVGIIDTGIDYLHPDFGGTGSLIDYQKNADRRHINPVDPENPGLKYFPTTKVAGGFDFVGDFYDGSNSPVPDPNPADCNGHGSHVAGTVAGIGVKTDGTPYTAGYDPLPNYSGFRIGPGVAPGAQLYALRVFGCGGGTSVLTEALEWAVDPNNDGDLSDHLDVVNMSLGAPEGFPSDVDAVAADTAALAGTIVVAANGNNGPGFFVASSPAAGRHVVAVAAIADGGLTGALLHETSPVAGNYPAAAARYVNPDNSVPPAPSGQSIQVVLANDGVDPPTDACEPTFTGNVNGKIVLIDRGGTCSFTDKVLHAQGNGAKGVIVADNVDAASPLVMGGIANSPITIPAIGVSKATGTAVKAQLAAGTVKVALTTANAGDTFASFSSRGPTIDVDGSVTLKPDLAAPGLDIPSVQSGVTCDDLATSGCLSPAQGGYIPGGQLLVISGTSMATPHVAGMMAILRQLNPDASTDELKALAMNAAAHDVTIGANGTGGRYGASSVGAGRVDVARAAASTIIAYNANANGSTSVTFDVEPVGSQSFLHDVIIVNGANVGRPVDLSIDTIEDAPGVAFSVVGPTTITLAPGQTVISVAMATDVAQMNRTCDPTLPKTESLLDFTLTRECIAEESASLKISSGGVELARVPLYAAIRPHSSLATTGLPAGSPVAGTAVLAIAGEHVCTGSLAAGPTCNADLSANEESLVSPFELQMKGAYDAALPGFANLHYAGVNYRPDPVRGDDEYLFGIAAYGKWGTPSVVAYNICVDTDGDGRFDKTVFNTDTGSVGPLLGIAPNPSNGYFTAVLNLPSVFFDSALNLVGPAAADTGVLDNNVMILGAHLSSLRLVAPTKITYAIAVCPAVDPLCTGFAPSTQCTGGDALASFGPFAYDPAHPGVDGQGKVLLEDLNGAVLQVPYDTQNLGANGSLGLLLIHHHNTTDKTAEVVVLDDLFADGFSGD